MFEPYEKRSGTGYVWSNRLADAVDTFPQFYMRAQRLRRRGLLSENRLVSQNHHIVIEAFPRSGSSFVDRAFTEANPDSAKYVATHTHRSAQVISAANMKIPTLVLVRNPRSAVTSLIALAIQRDKLALNNQRDVEGCIAESLRRYRRFYKRIHAVGGIVIVRFEDATRDINAVIARVNSVYGTEFKEFRNAPERVDALFASEGVHLSPSSERDELKSQLSVTYDLPRLEPLRARAEAIYERMMLRTEKIPSRQEIET